MHKLKVDPGSFSLQVFADLQHPIGLIIQAHDLSDDYYCQSILARGTDQICEQHTYRDLSGTDIWASVPQYRVWERVGPPLAAGISLAVCMLPVSSPLIATRVAV